MPDTIVNGNSQNEATGKHVKTRSKFDMSYHSFDTMRFGELHPHFVMESVPNDHIKMRSSHDVRSYSLKAPLMSEIKLKKDYFAVPMEAILPFNWDKIYTNPVIGDDVPQDAGTYVADFTSIVNTFLASLIPDETDTSESVSDYYTKLFRWLMTSELFCSEANLMSSLGIHLSNVWVFDYGTNDIAKTAFDYFFDRLIPKIISAITSAGTLIVKQDSSAQARYVTLVSSSSKQDWREAFDLMRDNLGTFVCVLPVGSSQKLSKPVHITLHDNVNFQHFGLDLKRLFAYQIVCAHYYSNDHIDYIYSAELYRQYIQNFFTLIMIVYSASSEEQVAYFDYNGIKTHYDYCSSFYFNRIISVYTDSRVLEYRLGYLQAIFGYKHSLRYMDYFVGAKSRPLAVGDVNVDVQTGTPNYVSVVDVTTRTQMQRFLNAVNRSGRKFSNYVKELFGNSVAPDYHNPFYLGHTADTIYGQEVENTNVTEQIQDGAGLAVVSNLRSSGGRFEFEFDSDRPCILLGISYFDVARSYWQSIERQNFHKDRFDYFNPYMQFIGDQAVYTKEITPWINGLGPNFAYQLRHAEYKQRYNQAQGGFVSFLPGYTFLNDMLDVNKYGVYHENISPDFIRSKSVELDRFYISLTHYCLAGYFHFIVDSYNQVEASRPMAYAPSIL